jgi:hypothetical protein
MDHISVSGVRCQVSTGEILIPSRPFMDSYPDTPHVTPDTLKLSSHPRRHLWIRERLETRLVKEPSTNEWRTQFAPNTRITSRLSAIETQAANRKGVIDCCVFRAPLGQALPRFVYSCINSWMAPFPVWLPDVLDSCYPGTGKIPRSREGVLIPSRAFVDSYTATLIADDVFWGLNTLAGICRFIYGRTQSPWDAKAPES